jgi:putative nucleotidyltransferase with HDIG domain
MFAFLKSLLEKKRTRRQMEKKGLVGSRKRRKEGVFSKAAEQSKLLGILILALVWVACVTVLMLPTPRNISSSLVEKQEAPIAVWSAFSFSYEDKDKTKENREEAIAEVPLYYSIDSKMTEQCLDDADELFEELLERISREKRGQLYVANPKKKVSSIIESLDKKSVQSLGLLIKDKEQRARVKKLLKQRLDKGVINQREKEKHKYGQIIRIIDFAGRIRSPKPLVEIPAPEEAAEEVANESVKLYSIRDKDQLKLSLGGVIRKVINGNMVFDKKQTLQEQEKAAAKILPVLIEVKRGEKIVAKGQKVDRHTLKLVNYYNDEFNNRQASVNFWRKFIESSIMSLLLMIITGIYIFHIHPEVIKSNQRMWLIGTVAILSIFINYFFVHVFNMISEEQSISPKLIIVIIPIALPAILLSVLVGLRVAVYTGLFISIIAAIMLGHSFDIIIQGLVLSCLVGFSVRYSSNYRSYFFRCLLAIFLTLLILDFTYMWEFRGNMKMIFWTAGLSGINAIVTSLIALLLLFIFEPLFQVSTNMTLLLLCDYNHPLLKRLQFEAPGTYHHSLMVSTLAEHAAQEIGANPIKARVGALFHDIGKLSKPEYFSENSHGSESKHNELHPRMSSLIILNHVKEGVDLALKYKLRKIIRDAIEQHHGTDIVYYFYKRALEESQKKEGQVEEQEYRYLGPLPREKEVVLISLADPCEAASRSLQKPSPAKIEALVWEIFRKRIRSGQLDEAELTFGELAKVRQSFVKTLTTMLHGRIAYPKDEQEENDEDDLFVAARRKTVAESESGGSGNTAGQNS